MLKESILKDFNIDLNFWKINPQLIIVFDDLYEKDKSKDKITSSKIMWAIAMLYDPSDKNQFRNADFDVKKKAISDNYLKDKNFDWLLYVNEIDLYKEYCLSVYEMELLVIEESLRSRRILLQTTPYTLKTASLLDDMHKKTSEIQKQHIELKKLIKEGFDKSKSRGNHQQSFLEKLKN